MNFVWVTKQPVTYARIRLSIGIAQHCFNRFKTGNLELADLSRSGEALQVDFDVLKQLIEEEFRLTARC